MRHLGSLLSALLLVVAVAACGDDDSTATTTTTAAATTTIATSSDGEVTIANVAFSPTELTVSAGTEVTWTNDDGFAHTTTSSDAVWDSGQLTGGNSFSFVFDEAGRFAYFCQIHPTMQATIVVEG